jgi:hypothetical protein
LDTYTRKRLDEVAVDVAVTRNTVETIEKRLSTFCARFGEQETRLKQVERRVFAIWVLGPVLLGIAAFLKNFTGR